MTTTEARWSERVREWRASGKTAEEFASGQGFEGSTLRYWSSRLKHGLPSGTKSVPAAAAEPRMARVVRRRSTQATVDGASVDELEVIVGPARIVVRRGFDAEILREIVVALGTTR